MRDWAKKQRAIMENSVYTETLQSLPNAALQNIDASYDRFIGQLNTVAACAGSEMSKDKIAKAAAKRDEICRLADKLNAFSIPNTLCHGDIRPGNICEKNGVFLLYDWGMSLYAHPFYDICHLLHVVRREMSEPDRERILTAYLQEWTDFAPMEALLEAYTTIDRLKFFIFVYMDCEWVMQILNACQKIPQYSLDNWLLTKRLYYLNRVFDRFVGIHVEQINVM